MIQNAYGGNMNGTGFGSSLTQGRSGQSSPPSGQQDRGTSAAVGDRGPGGKPDCPDPYIVSRGSCVGWQNPRPTVAHRSRACSSAFELGLGEKRGSNRCLVRHGEQRAKVYARDYNGLDGCWQTLCIRVNRQLNPASRSSSPVVTNRIWTRISEPML